MFLHHRTQDWNSYLLTTTVIPVSPINTQHGHKYELNNNQNTNKIDLSLFIPFLINMQVIRVECLV